MDYRSLGRPGVGVSPLCSGCMIYGGKTSREDSRTLIDHALDAGINFLESPNGCSRGRSAEVTGEAFKRNGKRDRGVLATKARFKMDDTDPNSGGNVRRRIIASGEASPRRLGTDWIVLFQIHQPQPGVATAETLRALDDLVRAGKVRHLGTRPFAGWQVGNALWASKELGLNRYVCEQPPYNILDRRIERELLPVAQTFELGIIPWGPLAGGFSRENIGGGELSRRGAVSPRCPSG